MVCGKPTCLDGSERCRIPSPCRPNRELYRNCKWPPCDQEWSWWWPIFNHISLCFSSYSLVTGRERSSHRGILPGGSASTRFYYKGFKSSGSSWRKFASCWYCHESSGTRNCGRCLERIWKGYPFSQNAVLRGHRELFSYLQCVWKGLDNQWFKTWFLKKMMKFLWLKPRCKKYADWSKCDILNDITLRRIFNNSTDWTKKISCYDM